MGSPNNAVFYPLSEAPVRKALLPRPPIRVAVMAENALEDRIAVFEDVVGTALDLLLDRDALVG